MLSQSFLGTFLTCGDIENVLARLVHLLVFLSHRIVIRGIEEVLPDHRITSIVDAIVDGGLLRGALEVAIIKILAILLLQRLFDVICECFVFKRVDECLIGCDAQVNVAGHFLRDSWLVFLRTSVTKD